MEKTIIYKIDSESFAKLIFDAKEDELEEIKDFARYRINMAIQLTGYKKTGLQQKDSALYIALAKYMDGQWGLGQSSIKKYLNGEFAQNRNQFIDFMNGITDFLHLQDVREFFLPNDKAFKKLLLKRRRQLHQSARAYPAQAVPSSENRAGQKPDKETAPLKRVQTSKIVPLKGIFKQIISCKYFQTGAWAAFSVCFIGNIILCHLAGTLIGNDPNRIYFLKDVPTLINYLIICPLYVGLNLVIVNLYRQLWSTTVSESQHLIQPSLFVKKTNLIPLSVLITILIPLSVIHANEIMQPAIYPKLYWYISGVTETGARRLGMVGVYYIIYNSVLIFFMLFTFVMFIKLILLAKKILNNFATNLKRSCDTSIVEKQLRIFACGYIVLKLIVVVYMGNTFTWRMANPNDSFNYFLMVSILTIIGIVAVPFFRYYVKNALHQLAHSEIIIDDKTPSFTTEIALFLDTLILFYFIYIFWSL